MFDFRAYFVTLRARFRLQTLGQRPGGPKAISYQSSSRRLSQVKAGSIEGAPKTKRRAHMGIDKIIEIAVSLTLIAAAIGNLRKVTVAVQRAQWQLLEESKASKWGNPNDVIWSVSRTKNHKDRP